MAATQQCRMGQPFRPDDTVLAMQSRPYARATRRPPKSEVFPG
jgi:hypothetical protein